MVVVEFPRYVHRGEGIMVAVSRGERLTPDIFIDDLRFTPEPLLAKPDDEALIAFLMTAYPLLSRRNKAQRAEGQRLLNLVEASTSDALNPEPRGLLCAWLRGDTLVSPKRPIDSLAATLSKRSRIREMAIYQRAVIKVFDDPSWKDPMASLINKIINENPAWQRLPRGEHVLHIVQAIMRAMRHCPPSIRTMRNRISHYRRPLRQFIVNASTTMDH